MEEPSLGACPFCDFTDTDTYALLLHVETLHSEDDSPFVVREAPDLSDHPINRQIHPHNPSLEELPSDPFGDDAEYVACPEPDCGEAIFLTELDTHIEMHLAEKTTADDGIVAEDYDPENTRKKRKVRRRHRDASERISGTDLQVAHRHPTIASETSLRHRSKLIADSSDAPARGWRCLFMSSSPAKKTAQGSTSSNPSGPRRLGVSHAQPTPPHRAP